MLNAAQKSTSTAGDDTAADETSSNTNVKLHTTFTAGSCSWIHSLCFRLSHLRLTFVSSLKLFYNLFFHASSFQSIHSPPVSELILSSVSFQPHLFRGTLTHLGRSLLFSLQLVIYFPIARALFFTLSPVVPSSHLLFPPVTGAAFSE